MDRRLAAIANRELWPLTAAEKARVTRAIAAAGIAIKRGKAPSNALDRVFADAETRVRDEIAAEEMAKTLKAREQAKKKAARGSIWW